MTGVGERREECSASPRDDSRGFGAPPAISVVIPTHNRAHLVAKALRALAAQTLSKEEFEVIVVSDGSTDDTEAVVERSQRAYSAEVAEATSATKAGRLGNLHFLCQPRRGPAAARNTGIGMARGRFVAFTDDDCIPERDWLRRIMDCFHDHPQALGIEGKTITDAERVTPLTHQVINLRGGRSRPTCNVSYVREALLKVGGFDEGYVFNGEDEDMALAVAEIGTIVFCESAIVVHPPRQMQFRDHLRRIVHLELQAMLCEFRLARKHPAGYRPLRGGGPWWSIFYLTALLRLYELWEGRGWLRKAPASWLAAALLLGLKMLWRLLLVPLTFVKLRSSECLGGAP